MMRIGKRKRDYLTDEAKLREKLQFADIKF
jgi:hypothetical protein